MGTSSLRRTAQVRAVRSDVEVLEVRGNVDTRLRKLAAGEVDALILAAAGLDRLGRGDEAGGLIEEFVPAAGQGALALEARTGAIAAERLAAVSRPRGDGLRHRRARAGERPRRLVQHPGGRPRAGARWTAV